MRFLAACIVTVFAFNCSASEAENSAGTVGGYSYQQLVSMGDAAIPVLMVGLESPQPESRRLAADALGTIKADPAVGALVKLAQSNDYSDRSSAFRALGRIGGPEAAGAIIAAYPRMNSSWRQNFAEVLGAIGDSRAIAPLADILASWEANNPVNKGEPQSQITSTRVAAARALGHYRDPRARTSLEKAIRDDPDWEVYHVARQALYQMDDLRYYPGYDQLTNLVTLAVAKSPEPAEGADKHVENWRKQNANSGGAWTGPELTDFASEVDIKRARDLVVERGKSWSVSLEAGGVVELLMEYLCNRKYYIGPQNAKAVLIQIGRPALPALENGVKRGDNILARNCRYCIDGINNSEK